MYKYKLIFTCADGFEGEEIVMAVNRIMAMEVFEAFGYEDVVSLECYRIEDEEDE
jgi:hypothetical protein